MRSRFSTTAAVTLPLFACLAVPFLSSTSRSTSRPPAENKYIGAAKCKNCHSSAESGDPYGVWSKAKHAHAFETLASSAEAKEAAAKLGITEPAKDDSCLACHVTGFGEPEDAFARGFKQELGVQCESCHGPAEQHMKARFKAAASGTVEGHQDLPDDEIVAAPGIDVCVKCHNPKSPSYKPFCFFESRGKIAHLDPRKPRTDEEKASFGKCPCGSPCPHADGCPDGKCNLKPDELAAMKAKK